jgi:WD40 repeat protein
LPHAQRIGDQGADVIQSATFVAGGQYLLTGDDGHTMQVTDVRDPEHPALVGTPLQAEGVLYVMATSPDGRLVVTGTGTAGRVDVWDAGDPTAIHRVATAPADGSPSLQVYGLSFTPDGRTVAVGSADDTVRMLDVTTPAAPRWSGGPVRDGTGYVNWLAFSADGHQLATASGDGDVRIYDSTTPARLRLVSVLTTPGSRGLYSVTFDPTGGQVSAGGIPESVSTWTTDPERAARHVCDLVGEPVAEKEWLRYVPSVPYRNPCR